MALLLLSRCCLVCRVESIRELATIGFSSASAAEGFARIRAQRVNNQIPSISRRADDQTNLPATEPKSLVLKLESTTDYELDIQECEPRERNASASFRDNEVALQLVDNPRVPQKFQSLCSRAPSSACPGLPRLWMS